MTLCGLHRVLLMLLIRWLVISKANRLEDDLPEAWPTILLNVTYPVPMSHHLEQLETNLATYIVQCLREAYGTSYKYSVGRKQTQIEEEGNVHIYVSKRNKERMPQADETRINMSHFLMSQSELYPGQTVTSQLMFIRNSSECDLTYVNMNDGIINQHGNLLIHADQTARPGDFSVVNDTFVVCNRDKAFSLLDEDVLEWVIMASMTVSVMCLVVHLVMTFIYNPRKRWRTTGLAACVLVTNATFLIGPYLSREGTLCYLAGVILHWGFLSAFCWMSFISVDTWMTLLNASAIQKVRPHTSRFLQKMLWPFVVSSILVTASLVFDNCLIEDTWRPRYGHGHMCWIYGRMAKIYLFVIPGVLALVISILFTSLCACRVYSFWRMAQNPLTKQRSYLCAFVKLAVVTGLVWCSGFVALTSGITAAFVVFVLMTASQGFWILVLTWASKCSKITRRSRSMNLITTNEVDLSATSV